MLSHGEVSEMYQCLPDDDKETVSKLMEAMIDGGLRIRVTEAAKMLRMGLDTLKKGLITEKFPFGQAVYNEDKETYTYLIWRRALLENITTGTRQVLNFNHKGYRTDLGA